jgi:glyoxylase-like metal-dependent hydrolase (beta-lactamase superfamily II)
VTPVQGQALSGLRYPAGLHKLADGVSAWLTPNGGWGESNAALITGRGSSLLVDTLWDLPRTRIMLDAFHPQIDGAPIEHLVNTHGDGDHWFGNQLVGAGQVISTKPAMHQMKRHGPADMKKLHKVIRLFRTLSFLPLPHRSDWRVAATYLDGMVRPFDFSKIRPVLPNTTFTGKLQVDVGGRPVQLIEVGPAHTMGDLVVFLPEDRILMSGDIVFLGCTPVAWEGSARNWIRACQRLLDLPVDRVVPGHGPLTDLAGIDAVRKYWQFLRAAVKQHFDHGRSWYEAALRIARSDEFQKQPFAQWDGRERIAINVHIIYRKLLSRPRRLSTLERIKLLRATALMDRDLRENRDPFD